MSDPAQDLIVDPQTQKGLFEGNWKIRRRVMFVTLLYIAFNVSWLIIRGENTTLNQQIALALVGSGTSIIGAYVFGAVWDDSNKRGALNSLATAIPFSPTPVSMPALVTPTPAPAPVVPASPTPTPAPGSDTSIATRPRRPRVDFGDGAPDRPPFTPPGC